MLLIAEHVVRQTIDCYMSSEEEIPDLISALPSMLRLQFVWVTLMCGMVGFAGGSKFCTPPLLGVEGRVKKEAGRIKCLPQGGGVEICTPPLCVLRTPNFIDKTAGHLPALEVYKNQAHMVCHITCAVPAAANVRSGEQRWGCS